MPLIEVISASRFYTMGENQIKALDQVSLSLESGDFAVLSGSSGSGKTTLLNLIGGIDLPDAGTVEVDGVSLHVLDEAARTKFRLHKIGFIFQAFNLLPVLNAFENIAFLLELQGVPSSQHREMIEPVLEQLRVLHLRDRRPSQMSGGQQQRIAIARALVSKPRVILADEPTASLDSKTAQELLSLMQELNQNQGITFLFSSHDQKVIANARSVIQMSDGKIIPSGTPC